jgi:phospholipid/cholesterol/gamma-HCH transport system permease protein
MITWLAGTLGHGLIMLCTMMGSFAIFLGNIITATISTRLKLKKVFFYMEQVGVDSLGIVLLTGTFTGAVLALQSYIGFKRYGGQELIGPLIALSMARELGPVLTGLMVTGRAGSAMAAEIGTMRITEQIDALITLRINPLQYLIVPRVVASTIILPCLSMCSVACGVVGGYFVVVYSLGLNGQTYLDGIKKYLELSDITNGLFKSAVFGLILSWVGCFKGYFASGGARGVGLATTQSVVMGSMLTILANYLLTAFLF